MGTYLGLRHGPAWPPPPMPTQLLLPGMFFLGFEDPDLSSLTESGQKWGPNCADDVPVRRARAPRTGTSTAQLGELPQYSSLHSNPQP